MARRVRRRKVGSGGVAPSDARLLIGIIVVIGLLAFYAYQHWNREPEAPIVGKAWVIDGDTVVISDTHIRLEGIDAPEVDQTCTDSAGKPWPCGKVAGNELRAHIRGQELTCQRRALDRYQRILAVCTLPDGSDVNAWLVRQGWAVAYGFARLYEDEEGEAKSAKRGIWTGPFVPPSQWRESHKE